MKLEEIIENIKMENPDTLGKMPTKKGVYILKEAFKEIIYELNNIQEGKLMIPNFGNFIIKVIEKEGEKTKRIIFRPSK